MSNVLFVILEVKICSESKGHASPDSKKKVNNGFWSVLRP